MAEKSKSKSNIRMLALSIFLTLYTVSILLSAFIDWESFLILLEKNFSLTLENSPVLFFYYNVSTTFKIIYPGDLRFLLIFFFAISMWAEVILSRGRSMLEAIALYFGYFIPKPRSLLNSVYNTNTNSPIPFSTITIESYDDNKERVFVANAISDLYGRFKLLLNFVPNKQYRLTVKAAGYNTLEKDISDSRFINRNIGLVPENSSSLTPTSLLHRFRNIHLISVIRYLFIIPTASLLFVTLGVLKELTIGTFIYFWLMLFSVIWNLRILQILNKPEGGKLILEDEKKGVGYLNVSLIKDNQKIATATSEADGSILFKVKPGVYMLELNSINCEIADSPDKKNIEVQIIQNGMLKKDLVIRRIDKKGNEGILANPFD